MQQEQHQRFLELLNAEYERLERFALSLTRRRDDAKELIAETIAQAIERFNDVESKKAFLSYLFSIASRTFYKQKARRQRVQLMEPESIPELYAGGLNAEDAHDLNLLYAAIDQLPDSYREVFVMAEIAGLSHKEIHETTQLSLANIKVRIYRAKFLLRKRLGIVEDNSATPGVRESATPTLQY